MADKRATLLITLKDEVTAGLNKIRGGIATLKENWLAVTAAVTGVVAIGVNLLNSFSEQETAVNRLNVALKNQGFYTAEYSAALVKLAENLQKTTTFSDESILATQATLTTFGLAGKQLEKTTKAALDLSTGLGVDLTTATLLLGKAWAGQTQTLARYGLKVDETKGGAEKFAEMLSIVNSRFGGSAEAQLNTYSGRIENLKNRFSDLKEKLGAELLPVAEMWLGWVNRAIEKVDKAFASDNENLKGRQLTIQTLSKEIAARHEMIGTLGLEGAAKDAVLVKIQQLEEARKREIALLKDEQATRAQSAPAAPESKVIQDTDLTEQAQKKIDSLTLTHQEIEQKEVLHLARMLQLNQQHEKSKALIGALYEKQRESAAKSTLANIATFSSAKNKQLAAVGKAAGIGQATVDTWVAANVALRSAPPPFNFILMGSVIAAGLANVAKIAGVPMAEGGMVLPTSGGTSALIGEGGRSEAVIPLDDPSTKEKLADVIGGNTIVIQAGTIVANDYDVRKFAMRIDEELYRLSKRRGRVS